MRRGQTALVDERKGEATPAVGGSTGEDFAPWFDEIFLPLLRLVGRVVRDATEAEDIAAEAMARAYARWPRVRGLEYRDAWVTKVAMNLALDHVRRRRPRPYVSGYPNARLRFPDRNPSRSSVTYP